MARPGRGMKRSSSGRLRNKSLPDVENFTISLPTEDHAENDVNIASMPTGSGDANSSDSVRRVALLTNTLHTETMGIESQHSSEVSLPPRDKGKRRVLNESEEKPLVFDFMELPAELRLEIYRACLTRPYKILLAKYIEPPPEPVEADEAELSDTELERLGINENARRNAIAELQRMRAARALPSRNAANAMLGRVARAGGQSRPLDQLPRPSAPRRRQSHTVRFSSLFAPSLPTASSSAGTTSAPNALQSLVPARPIAARQSMRPSAKWPRPTAPQKNDPLIVNILRLNKALYKEARSLLYSENIFDLSIDTAVPSLAALHQRSRRLIRHVELEIPSYTEIQEKFSEVVRLALRYCSGLRKLVIHTPFCLPGGDGTATPNSNTQIWAQGFDILRWLPQTCEVELKGHKNPEIDEVVNKHLQLAKTLSPVAYAHRQLIPSDSDRSS